MGINIKKGNADIKIKGVGALPDTIKTTEALSALTKEDEPPDALLVKNINNSLTELEGNAVNGFTEGNYQAVTGLAYDATTKQLGLKVGADTVIPFKKGEASKWRITGSASNSGSTYWGCSEEARVNTSVDITISISADGVLSVSGSARGSADGTCYEGAVGASPSYRASTSCSISSFNVQKQ